MKRLMVIGCCGSGKSTFSKKLQEITKLPLIHLDQCYWLPNWEEPGKESWSTIMIELVKNDKWIIDGNYGGTMNIRIERADTIIYLDYPTWKCLWRITKRILRYRGQVRPDMPTGCAERFDLDFYHYVATFNMRRRKGILRKLKKVEDEKQIFRLTNNKAIEKFLDIIRKQ